MTNLPFLIGKPIRPESASQRRVHIEQRKYPERPVDRGHTKTQGRDVADVRIYEGEEQHLLCYFSALQLLCIAARLYGLYVG